MFPIHPNLNQDMTIDIRFLTPVSGISKGDAEVMDDKVALQERKPLLAMGCAAGCLQAPAGGSGLDMEFLA